MNGNPEIKTKKKFYQKWWFWLIVVFVIGGPVYSLVINGGFEYAETPSAQESQAASMPESSTAPKSSSASSQISESVPPQSDSAPVLSFGDTFEFDDLEITFTDNVTWHKVDNEFSDNDGAEVFAVPVTIKNTSQETHGLNMFSYKMFGSNGTQINSMGPHFDDDINFMGDMRSGAQISGFMYFLYDGDGDYYIEFSYTSRNKVEVKIPITK